MKKRTTILLALMLSISLVACGGKENEEVSLDTVVEEIKDIVQEESKEETVDEIIDEEIVEEVVEEITEEKVEEVPKNLSGENVVEEVPEKNTIAEKATVEKKTEEKIEEVPVDTTVEETTEKKVEEVPVDTTVANTTNNVENVGNEEDVSTEVPVNSTVIPTNENSNNVTSSSEHGAEYTGETITTDSGFSIPLIRYFNSLGMGTNTSFAGSWDSSEGSPLDTMLDTLDAYGVHNDSATADFLINGNKMQWYPHSMDGSPALELRQCGDHYKIIINGPHLDVTTSQSLGWAGIYESDERVAREALLVILSCISSKPQEIQSAILRDLFSEVCINESWTSIGDAYVRIDVDNCKTTDGDFIFTYQIKGQ